MAKHKFMTVCTIKVFKIVRWISINQSTKIRLIDTYNSDCDPICILNPAFILQPKHSLTET